MILHTYIILLSAYNKHKTQQLYICTVQIVQRTSCFVLKKFILVDSFIFKNLALQSIDI